MRGAVRTAIALTIPPPFRAGAPTSRWERGGGKIKMGPDGWREAGQRRGTRHAQGDRIAIAAERGNHRPGPEEPAGCAVLHAEPLRLPADLGRAQALRETGCVGLAHLRGNEPAALAGYPEGVHQMRVALRRLWAAVAALKGAIPAVDRRAIAGELARLDALLAPVRNLDVVLTELLPPVRRARPDDRSLDHLAAMLAGARRAAQDRLAGELRSARHERAMLILARRFAGCARTLPEPAGTTVGALLPALLDRRWRAVRKRSKGFRRQSPRARHRLRIAVRELRTVIELFGGARPGEDSRAFLKELRRLQDGLGALSDLRAARVLLRRPGAAAAPEIRRAGKRLVAWHRRALAGREDELRSDLRRLRRAPRFWRNPGAHPL